MDPDLALELEIAAAAAKAKKAKAAGVGAVPPQANSDVGAGGAFMANLAPGMTLGFADEIAAGIGSVFEDRSYDEILAGLRNQDAAIAEEYPASSMAGQVAGSLAVPMGAMKSTGTLWKDALKSSGIGAGMAGLFGFGSGEGGVASRAESALDAAKWGAVLGGAVPAVGAIVQKGANSLEARKVIADLLSKAPSTDDLRASGNAAYKAVDAMGVQIDPAAFGTLSNDIITRMRSQGMDSGSMSLTPQSSRLAEVVRETATPTPIPFSEVEMLRRKAGVPAGNMGVKAEANIGSGVIGDLDDFIGNLTPAQVTAGNADDLGEAITTARSIWSKMSKSQLIDDAVESSKNYLSGEASGIKNRFKSILGNKQTARGFSEAEKALMRKVINGTIPENMLNLASSGLGQLLTIGTGAALGSGTPGGSIAGVLAGAALSASSRKAAEALARRKAEVVRGVVASGGLPSMPMASTKARELAELLMRRGAAGGAAQ